MADLYKASRVQYRRWLDAGKPREGPDAVQHFEAKARFKYALRYIKRHEQQLQRNTLARKIDQDGKTMWQIYTKHQEFSTVDGWMLVSQGRALLQYNILKPKLGLSMPFGTLRDMNNSCSATH